MIKQDCSHGLASNDSLWRTSTAVKHHHVRFGTSPPYSYPPTVVLLQEALSHESLGRAGAHQQRSTVGNIYLARLHVNADASICQGFPQDGGLGLSHYSNDGACSCDNIKLVKDKPYISAARERDVRIAPHYGSRNKLQVSMTQHRHSWYLTLTSFTCTPVHSR